MSYPPVNYTNNSSRGWLPADTVTGYANSSPHTHSNATAVTKPTAIPSPYTITHTREDTIGNDYCSS